MTTPMKTLRADMMTKPGGGFTRREKKRIEFLSPGNEEQRRLVMEALPRKSYLRSHMACCGTRSLTDNIIYCGVPLCPRCHMRERTRQSAIAIKKVFAGAANEEMAFVTILLPVQLDFGGITSLFETEKRRLRTFVDRRRKQDDRWNDFQLMGWWEIDRMNHGDYKIAGRNTQLALDDLDFPVAANPDTTIWRPHLHAVIRLGRLKAVEVTEALRKSTHTGSYQVDLQPFHTDRDLANNLKNVIRYSLKFRIETDYKRPDALDFIEAEVAENKSRPRAWWPANDIAAYMGWLCPTQRSGFQSLRVMIGNKASDDAEAMIEKKALDDQNARVSARAIRDRLRRQKEKEQPLGVRGISSLSISSALKEIEMKRKQLVLSEDHVD